MKKMVVGRRILSTRGFPTPFGQINLPEINTPVMRLPEMDSRRRKAVKHVVATDLTGILAFVPYLGAALGGQLSDLHYAEVRKILTPEELNRYIEADKRIPANGPALLYSFVKGSLPGVR